MRQIEQITSKYLFDFLKIPVSKKYLEKLILSHPDYPSLLSIVDALERLGIHHRAARIAKEDLVELETPYLLQLEKKGRELLIIKDERAVEKVHLTYGDNVQAIALQAEPTNFIPDEENQKQRSEEFLRKVSSIVLVSALAAILLLNSIWFFSWFYVSLLLTAVLGTVAGYLLVAKEIGVTYESIESFCKAGKKTNCDAVLNSDAAKLYGNFTFSDAAASYFVLQLTVIGLLFPVSGETASFLGVLSLLSALTVPVIIYSIYYQAVKLKIWCGLCLAVDAILILQITLFVYMYYTGIIVFNTQGFLPLTLTILLLGVTGMTVLLLKDKFKAANRSMQIEVAANRMKYSPEVFKHLLFQGKQVDTTPFKNELIIGNPHAPIKIIMAASFGCGPCKKGFEKAAQIVKTYSGKTSLIIRFLLNRPENGKHRSVPGDYILSYWLHHIAGKNDESERSEKLVRDWYALMDIEKFINQYPMPVNKDADGVSRHRLKHSEWFSKAEIKGTPTFFINGHELPRVFGIEDLMALVPVLVDHFQYEMKENREEYAS